MDLRSALALLLMANPQCKIEQRTKAILPCGIVFDLSANVADDAVKSGAQEFEFPPRALTLSMRPGRSGELYLLRPLWHRDELDKPGANMAPTPTAVPMVSHKLFVLWFHLPEREWRRYRAVAGSPLFLAAEGGSIGLLQTRAAARLFRLAQRIVSGFIKAPDFAFGTTSQAFANLLITQSPRRFRSAKLPTM